MNLNLFLFTCILLSRTLFWKFLNYQTYLGASSWLRKAPGPQVRPWLKSLIWVTIVGFIVLAVVVTSQLFAANSFHNFVCLFYP